MITLSGADGARAQILERGATLARLQMPHRGRLQDCILVPPRGDQPDGNAAYLGVIAGRYANRIAGGSFSLAGVTYSLDRNEDGRTTLHGGAGGFSTRLWEVETQDDSSVTLRLLSSDGDQGFPGNLAAQCTYSLSPGKIEVNLKATCDRPCPVNLTNHAYFNLDGHPTTAEHRLTIPAETYVPSGEHLIPLGHLAPVGGTPYDFRSPGVPDRSLDATYPIPGHGLRLAARLTSLANGLTMEVHTTKPGVHLYDGFLLNQNRDGHGPHAGLCLETQFYPDSPNQPAFPDSVLRPGEVYHHVTEFRFVSGT